MPDIGSFTECRRYDIAVRIGMHLPSSSADLFLALSLLVDTNRMNTSWFQNLLGGHEWFSHKEVDNHHWSSHRHGNLFGDVLHDNMTVAAGFASSKYFLSSNSKKLPTFGGNFYDVQYVVGMEHHTEWYDFLQDLADVSADEKAPPRRNVSSRSERYNRGGTSGLIRNSDLRYKTEKHRTIHLICAVVHLSIASEIFGARYRLWCYITIRVLCPSPVTSFALSRPRSRPRRVHVVRE